MARAAAATVSDLQPLDRLEDKVHQLVSMIDTLRAERARSGEEIVRLERELDAAREHVNAASGASTELANMREERELIRNRVTQMIAEIDKLDL